MPRLSASEDHSVARSGRVDAAFPGRPRAAQLSTIFPFEKRDPPMVNVDGERASLATVASALGAIRGPELNWVTGAAASRLILALAWLLVCRRFQRVEAARGHRRTPRAAKAIDECQAQVSCPPSADPGACGQPHRGGQPLSTQDARWAGFPTESLPLMT
jgi:hypothetical protein